MEAKIYGDARKLPTFELVKVVVAASMRSLEPHSLFFLDRRGWEKRRNCQQDHVATDFRKRLCEITLSSLKVLQSVKEHSPNLC